MNQLNDMIGTVSNIAFGFLGIVVAAVAIDLWAQGLSHRRCRQVLRSEVESYLRPPKRIY